MSKVWGIINADICTMSPARPRAEAMAIEGDRILAVGRTGDVAPLLRNAPIHDAQGRAVLPGFIDCHVHAVWTGMAMFGADLVGSASVEDLLERLAGFHRRHPDAEWLCANGYDESVMAEGRPPTLHDLDSLELRRPVLVRQRGGHSCVVNSIAFRRLDVNPDTEGVERSASGEPTGRLRGDALLGALARAGAELDPSRREEAISRACETALSKGVTTLHALQKAGPGDAGTIKLLSRGDWPVRIIVYPTTLDAAWAASEGFGRVGGCILLDGALEAHTAALLQPYADESRNVGRLYLGDDEVRGFVVAAHERCLQVSVHAVGERAIGQALDALAYAIGRHPRPDHRHRIEHFILPTSDQISRAAALGVSVCAQPAFEGLWGGSGRWFEKLIGSRWRRTTPLRAMLDAGILVAGGSDSLVCPIDPLSGIHAAVNHPNVAQRISCEEAVRLFTANAARMGFQEDEVGALLPGTFADIVVLSRNPMLASPEQLAKIAVVMTVVGGCVRYESRSAGSGVR